MRFRGSKFTLPVFGTAMGIYLPYQICTPIFIGGVLAALVGRKIKNSPDKEKTERKGVLLASGMIVGESLFGVFLALIIVFTGSSDPFEVNLPFHLNFGMIGAILFTAIMVLSYRIIVRK